MTLDEIGDFIRLVIGNIGRRMVEWAERKNVVSIEEACKRMMER